MIPASRERVWRALVEPHELEKWWCDEAEVDPRPGGTYAFGGPHVYGGLSASQTPRESRGGKILDFTPPERLEFSWQLGGVETRVVYELANILEETELSVLQTADRAPAWDPGHGLASWWWPALPALRSFVEKGRPDLRLDFAAPADRDEIVLEVGVTTFPWIIWHKLTDGAQLARWWGRPAELDLRPGGRFVLGRAGAGPREVLDVDEGRRFVHDWVSKGGTRGRVEWTLEDTEEEVRLAVNDLGPRDASLPRDAFLLHWSSMLLYLKQLSERGTTPWEYQDG
ncbi:MAG TPA: SRPBCC family protein [Planctomycetota bacterium]|nr:SRPBCC family protein [Planctomycetota bacterium]